jgi:hypothetical protein
MQLVLSVMQIGCSVLVRQPNIGSLFVWHARWLGFQSGILRDALFGIAGHRVASRTGRLCNRHLWDTEIQLARRAEKELGEIRAVPDAAVRWSDSNDMAQVEVARKTAHFAFP